MARFSSYRSAGTPGYQPTKETDVLVAVLTSKMSSARGRLKGRNHDGGVVNELAAGVSKGGGGDRKSSRERDAKLHEIACVGAEGAGPVRSCAVAPAGFADDDRLTMPKIEALH